MELDKHREKFEELKLKYPALSDYILFGRVTEGKLLSWKDFTALLKELVPEDDYVQSKAKETEKAILHLWERTATGKRNKRV